MKYGVFFKLQQSNKSKGNYPKKNSNCGMDGKRLFAEPFGYSVIPYLEDKKDGFYKNGQEYKNDCCNENFIHNEISLF